MKTIVRIFQSMVVLMFCLLLILGCKQKSSDQTVLTFYVYGQASLLDCWKRVSHRYEQQHPDIKIKISHVPGYNAYFSKILVELAAGNAPDVVFMNSMQVPAFVDRNALLSLSPDDGQAVDPDFYPQSIELFHYKQNLWAFPSDLAIYVLFYNPQLFDRFGMAYPNRNWTWDDLLLAARKLTVISEDNTPQQFGLIRGNPYLWIGQNAGRIVDDVANPKRCLLSEVACVDAITFMRDLDWKYHAVPSATSQKEMDTEQMFRTGRLAMMFGGHWWLPSLSQSNVPFKLAVIPGNKDRASYFAASGFSVMASTQHPSQAKDFATYLAGSESQAMLAELNFGFPARKSLAQSKEFLNALPGVDKQAFVDSVPFLKRAPQTPHANQIDSLIWRGLERVWTGQQTPTEAAKTIGDAIDKLLVKQVGEVSNE